jgi:hypothetical protein
MRTNCSSVIARGITAALLATISIVGSAWETQAQTLSPSQCIGPLDAFIARHRLQVDQATKDRAARHCAAGDLEGAAQLLRTAKPGPVPPRPPSHPGEVTEAQCLERLQAFIRKIRSSPSEQTMTIARRNCAAGDVAGALRVVASASPRPESPPQPMPEAQCLARLDEVIRGRRLEVSNEDLARARRYCSTGDLRGALAFLRSRQ